MSGFIDLHIHTTASDGSLSPSEAVALAAKAGMKAIAITDHDTAEGIGEAAGAAVKFGIELVPGIELSVDYKGRGIHILAYFIDTENEHLRRLLDWVISERERRNKLIARAMREDGIDVSLDALHKKNPDSVIGRPHFAAELVNAGLVKSVKEGFDKYLSPGGRYYRKREYIPMDMAFDALSKCGAKAVFAHPLQYRFSHTELLELTALLKEKGIVGMECIYSVYSPEESAYLKSLAADFELCVTGGSDFHGAGKPHISIGSGCGDMKVDYELLEMLKEI
ncbi:MAG: PHP domain-containing protein [Ruminococcaceae bacterium]|nr:PHP domain-containing protein [Oscillospiraceae bacterium]